MENLECDEAFVLHVLREIHRCHSATAELAIDGVSPRYCAAESIQRRRVLHHSLSRRFLYRGLARTTSRSLSCSIQSLSPYPRSTACSSVWRASSILFSCA